MAQYKIRINPPSSSASIFSPANKNNVTTLDNVFWVNYDSQAHWPAPVDNKGKVVQKGWLSSQIPGVQPGQEPAASGAAAFFNPDETTGKSVPYTVQYKCYLHPTNTKEQGSITVTSE